MNQDFFLLAFQHLLSLEPPLFRLGFLDFIVSAAVGMEFHTDCSRHPKNQKYREGTGNIVLAVLKNNVCTSITSRNINTTPIFSASSTTTTTFPISTRNSLVGQALVSAVCTSQFVAIAVSSSSSSNSYGKLLFQQFPAGYRVKAFTRKQLRSYEWCFKKAAANKMPTQ